MSNTRRWNVPPYLRYSVAPAQAVRDGTHSETVEQWLAAGNKIERCPPGHPPLSYDRFVEILANVPGVYDTDTASSDAVDREPNGRRRRSKRAAAPPPAPFARR